MANVKDSAKGGSTSALNARVSNPKVRVRPQGVSGFGARGVGKPAGQKAAPGGFKRGNTAWVQGGGPKKKAAKKR